MTSHANIKRRVDAAQGRIPCDLLLKGVRYFNAVAWEAKLSQ